MPEMPDWKSLVEERLRTLRCETPAEPDLTAELAQHLEDYYRELCSGGASEEAAYQRTLSVLDDVYPLRAEVEGSNRMAKYDAVPAGDARPGNLFEDFCRDLGYGGRAIRKSPLFTLAAVLCLGMGIGANTTVFTIINTLLLHPLPASDPSRLVVLYDAQASRRTQQWSQPGLAYANLQDYMAGQKCFRSVAAFTWPQVLTLAGTNGPGRMFGELVSGQYFDTLGLTPALGRFFLPSEAREPGSAPVAVMSYGAWQARFGGARDVLGRTLELNNVVFTVIGVAPKDFLGVSAVFGPDVWLPATMSERVFPAEFRSASSDRAKPLFHGVGRLRNGFSIVRAQASLDPLAATLAREYPKSNEGHGISVRPVTDELYFGAGGTSGLALTSAVLLIVVMLVLGIACSNVANLLLARAAARRHEIGLRLAIGASRGRLIRQLLTESALLSLVSCVAGVGLGYAGCHFVWSFVPTQYIHNMVAPKFDGGVLGFAVLVSLVTAALFGLAPALRASRTDVAAALKEETAAAGSSPRTLSFTSALVIGQVAFSLLCLITAALFFRSIGRAYAIDPGFQTNHLALVMMNPSQAGYDPQRVKEFYRVTRDRIQSLPGAASVSRASGMPFWNSASRSVGDRRRGSAEEVRKPPDCVDHRRRGLLPDDGNSAGYGTRFQRRRSRGVAAGGCDQPGAGGAALAGRQPARAAFSFCWRQHLAPGGWGGEKRQLLDPGRNSSTLRLRPTAAELCGRHDALRSQPGKPGQPVADDPARGPCHGQQHRNRRCEDGRDAPGPGALGTQGRRSVAGVFGSLA